MSQSLTNPVLVAAQRKLPLEWMEEAVPSESVVESVVRTGPCSERIWIASQKNNNNNNKKTKESFVVIVHCCASLGSR